MSPSLEGGRAVEQDGSSINGALAAFGLVFLLLAACATVIFLRDEAGGPKLMAMAALAALLLAYALTRLIASLLENKP
jgi:hypothetical protein